MGVPGKPARLTSQELAKSKQNSSLDIESWNTYSTCRRCWVLGKSLNRKYQSWSYQNNMVSAPRVIFLPMILTRNSGKKMEVSLKWNDVSRCIFEDGSYLCVLKRLIHKTIKSNNEKVRGICVRGPRTERDGVGWEAGEKRRQEENRCLAGGIRMGCELAIPGQTGVFRMFSLPPWNKKRGHQLTWDRWDAAV